MRRSPLTLIVLLTLACGGVATPEAPPTPEVPAPAPVLGWVDDAGGEVCALVTQQPGQERQVLARWGGDCGHRQGIAHHHSDADRQLVLTLGETPRLIEVRGSEATELPPPSEGTLEIADYDGKGGVIAWTEAEVQGKDTGMFGRITCRRFVHDGTDWQQTHEEEVGLGEGMSPPWCDGADGEPLSMDFPARFAAVYELTEGTLPPGQPAPPELEGADLGSWHYLEDPELLVRSYWFEGQFLVSPVLRWDGSAWVPLPGMGAIEKPIEVKQQGQHVLICLHDQPALLTDRSGAAIWQASTCPVFWPTTP